MNKLTILAIGAVFAVSMIAITAFEVEAVKPQAQSVACPAENVQHWNKIGFELRSSVFHDTLPTLVQNNFFEMIVQVDPNDVNQVSELLAVRMNELGYVDDQNRPITAIAIQNIDVEYSTICAEN